MKTKTFRMIAMLVVVLTLAVLAFSPMPVLASTAGQPPGVAVVSAAPAILDTVVSLTIMFASLLGIAALVTVLVNLGKLVHLVKDGTSQYWSAGLNLVAFITLVVLGIFRPDLTTVFLDATAQQIATVLVFVLGFVAQLSTSPKVYTLLRDGDVPIIGKSFSKVVGETYPPSKAT